MLAESIRFFISPGGCSHDRSPIQLVLSSGHFCLAGGMRRRNTASSSAGGDCMRCVTRGVSAFAIGSVVLLLGGCSDPENTPMDADLVDLIKWSELNPPVSEDTWRGVKRVVCKPAMLDVCNNETCRSIDVPDDPPITVTWYPAEGLISRCDRQNCDEYKPQMSYSGSFANVAAPANAMIFRVTASGEYREILNLARDTWVYRGQCARE